MANLSNINNKFIVTDGGQALVNQTSAGFNPDADDLIVGNLSGNTGITIASGSSAGNYGSIYFADGAGSSTASKAGYIRYEQNTSKMTIGINAVEKIAIDISGNTAFTGNLDIGPDALDIQIKAASNNSGNNLIYMRGNASNDKSSLQMNHFGYADYYIGVGHVGNGKFNIANDLTGDDFVIDTSGNVGIGTPIPGGKLSVGSGLAKTSTSTSEVLYLGQSNEASNYFVLQGYTKGAATAANRMINFQTIETGVANAGRIVLQPSGGQVAIGGEGFSSQMLTIAAGTLGAIYATSTNAGCFASFRDSSSTANIEYGAIGNAHVFRKDAAEYMRIDGNGNVGIGTTSPGRGLTIDKSNANAALEIIKNNTTNQIVYLGTGSSGGTDDPLLRMFHNGTENISYTQLVIVGLTAVT